MIYNPTLSQLLAGARKPTLNERLATLAWQHREVKRWTYAPSAVARRKLVLSNLERGLVQREPGSDDFVEGIPATYPDEGSSLLSAA